METKDIITWVVLAVIWVRVIWHAACLNKLEESMEETREDLINWIYDIGKSVEKYGEMPDNLKDHEKIRMEALQAEAKEWGEKNAK